MAARRARAAADLAHYLRQRPVIGPAIHARVGSVRSYAADGEDDKGSRADNNHLSELGASWSARKHQCRFAENDILVMHPDTNRGIEVLLNPIYNKGTGFSSGEKERLGIRGLVPPRSFSIEDQKTKIWETLNHTGKTNMHKWRGFYRPVPI